MKKWFKCFFLLLLVISLLSGCQSKNNEAEPDGVEPEVITIAEPVVSVDSMAEDEEEDKEDIPVYEASTFKEWENAIASALEDIVNNKRLCLGRNGQTPYRDYTDFALEDVDDDGVPELLLTYFGGEHGEGNDLYKYSEGDLIHLKDFNNYNARFCDLQKYRDTQTNEPVFMVYEGSGRTDGNEYISFFEEGGGNTIWGNTHVYSDNDNLVIDYYIGTERASEEKYNEFKEDFNKRYVVQEITFYPLGEDGIAEAKLPSMYERIIDEGVRLIIDGEDVTFEDPSITSASSQYKHMFMLDDVFYGDFYMLIEAFGFSGGYDAEQYAYTFKDGSTTVAISSYDGVTLEGSFQYQDGEMEWPYDILIEPSIKYIWEMNMLSANFLCELLNYEFTWDARTRTARISTDDAGRGDSYYAQISSVTDGNELVINEIYYAAGMHFFSGGSVYLPINGAAPLSLPISKNADIRKLDLSIGFEGTQISLNEFKDSISPDTMYYIEEADGELTLICEMYEA